MLRAIPRLSAILLSGAVAAAPAMAAPMSVAAPPAAPAPVAVPYPDTAPSIEVTALSWRSAAAVQPQEMTSDPQEGGEIARKSVRKAPRPTISEMTVSKRTDVSSSTLLRSTNDSPKKPGKLEIPNMQANGGGDNPPPAGTATITVARGHCASGQHFPSVKLTMRGQSYTLQDVDVVSCTPSGDNVDTCTLSYGSVAG